MARIGWALLMRLPGFQNSGQSRKRVLPQPFHLQPETFQDTATEHAVLDGEWEIGAVLTESIVHRLLSHRIDDPVFANSGLFVFPKFLDSVARPAVRAENLHTKVGGTVQV